MARPRKHPIEQPAEVKDERGFVFDMNQLNTFQDVKSVLEYLTKDIKIAPDGDLTGIAHLVKML